MAIIESGPMKGYQVVGDLKLGSKVQVVKPGRLDGYTVSIKADGSVACGCPAAKFRGGNCKHATYIRSQIPAPVRHDKAVVEPLIVEVLKALAPACTQAEVMGSYRRQKPDLKDVDILLIGDPREALKIISTLGEDVVMAGEFIIRFHYHGILFDLTFTKKETWGAAVLYRTGSQAFNINCRGKAKAKGMKLNEYGLFDRNEVLIEAESEAGILRHLGIGWVEPKDR